MLVVQLKILTFGPGLTECITAVTENAGSRKPKYFSHMVGNCISSYGIYGY